MDIKLNIAPALSITFERSDVLADSETPFQHVQVVDNPYFGRMLIIDGVVQLTERDTHIYHEMLVHPAAQRAKRLQRILIVGGGDGFAARECLRYDPDEVIVVDIDPVVPQLAKEFFSTTGGAALEDGRVRLLSDDGFKFVSRTSDKYDLIVIDSTDYSPYSKSNPLFGYEFYVLCKRALSQGGVFVCQQGIPVLSPKSFKRSVQSLQKAFTSILTYGFCVPSFVGGSMACTLGSASSLDDSHRPLPGGLIYADGSACLQLTPLRAETSRSRGHP